MVLHVLSRKMVMIGHTSDKWSYFIAESVSNAQFVHLMHIQIHHTMTYNLSPFSVNLTLATFHMQIHMQMPSKLPTT